MTGAKPRRQDLFLSKYTQAKRAGLNQVPLNGVRRLIPQGIA